MSQVSDPSSVVSSAAYLLFYRRRSSAPLGGPRFQEIFDKFDNPAAEDEDSATEIGDDRSEDNFAGTGHRLSNHTTTTTVRPLNDSDDNLPAYGQVHQSVEDEGLGMDDDPYGITDSNPISQNWSFGNSKGNTSPYIASADSDAASDVAQISQDEREDVDMKSVAADHSDSEDKRDSRLRRDSDEVAEVHIDGGKDPRHE